LIAATIVLVVISRGHRGWAVRVALVAVILIDLHAFNWTIASRAEARTRGRDDFGALLDAHGVADFLKSRPGLFRVHFDGDLRPNIGDFYGLQTVNGKMATILTDLLDFSAVPHYPDLLNIRYFIVGVNDVPRGATLVYRDVNWAVLESPGACPRAWLVHDFVVEPDLDRAYARLKAPSFDPRRTAILSDPPGSAIAAANGTNDRVTFDVYEARRIEIRVHSDVTALLVLSEMNYPGWDVHVNGRIVPTYRADGMLRALIAPAGDSRVTMEYAPGSFLAGAILSVLTFTIALGMAARAWLIERSRKEETQ
jgi:hypothetical protein